jgi:hypothetical protein
MDLRFPLEIESGTLSLADATEARRSQIQAYLNVYQGERLLQLSYGRVTQPMTSTKNTALLAELERLNAVQYFPGIQFSVEIVANRTVSIKVTA